MMPDAKFSTIAGLGDRAILAYMPKVGTQLTVIRGKASLVVAVVGMGATPKTAEAAEKLARKALTRL